MQLKEGLRYGTVMLDFHGTFTNNEGRLASALNTAYVRVTGRTIRKEEFQTILRREEEVSIQEKLNQMIDGQMHPEDKAALIKTYRDEMDRIYIPKHRYLIPALANLGALLVIVTNGNEEVVKSILEKWGLVQYFDKIYGRGPEATLQGLKRKPDPSVIDFVIQDLRSRYDGIKRDRILMVGDYKDDISAGNNAGVHTAFLVTGPNQKPEDYGIRPTYTLLDNPGLEVTSKWLKDENVFPASHLPKLVSGKI